MAESTGVEVKSAGGAKEWFSSLVIFGSILVGVLIYVLILGSPSNFVDGDPNNHPVESGPGQVLGLMYKGGMLVPIALGLLLMLVTFSIERFITLTRAGGSGSIDVFVQKVQMYLDGNDVASAMDECDRQRGTVGNVVKEVLKKYRDLARDKEMDKGAKGLALQKSLEESVALELPMLEKHLIIIATIVSIATLLGLIGTVLGMIKAFSALATSGTPDAAALATGISEALINTALGISTSTIATIMYNLFTSNIDNMTYKIDEAGFSIVQTFAEKHSTQS